MSRSGRWFRFYDAVLDDPKVQRLTPEQFRFWVNLLCLASRHNGQLPKPEEAAFSLRVTPEQYGPMLRELVQLGLFDRCGSTWEPHNWASRQFKSDTSADRMRRHRERHRDAESDVTVTPSDTDTETDTETEKKIDTPPEAAPMPFDEAVDAYNAEAEKAGWSKCQRLTAPRKSALKARLSECGGIEGWQTAMAKAGESRFLTGKVPRGKGHENWLPNFDWFVTASNFTKLMEGTYDNRNGPANDHINGRDGIAADFAAAAHLLRDKQYDSL